MKILSSQFDMGQGSYHGIATLVLEELGARWDQVEVEGGWGNPNLFGNPVMGGFQGTGGSTSMAGAWDRYRQAGAAARAMLAAAAAERWGVPASEITVTDGRLTHPTAGSLGFGEVAEAAALLPVPADVPLKSAADWTVIGDAAVRRYDSAPKTNGTHPFTIDVALPGMLTAVMIHPPRFGATAASFDATAAKAMPGVVDVVATPRGIAVVGEHMWAALKARDAVTVEWDEAAAETRGTDAIMGEYRTLAAGTPAAMALDEGDTDAALAGAAQVLEAEFEFPYLAHAALEPLNAVARRDENGVVEVWGGMQSPDLYQMILTEVAGVTPDKLRLHVMKTGGGFGRRAVFDADVLVEAVAIARALDWRAPVKVQWTRENDMRGGRYRPAYVHKVRAGLDADGALVGWDHHIVGQSIMAGGPFAIQDGVDPTSIEGALHLPYAIPNRSVGLTSTDVRVPVLWWRSVGSTHNAYVVETFLDELAAAAGKDPLEFRLSMMEGSPRHAGVLRLAAEKAGWGTPPPEGQVARPRHGRELPDLRGAGRRDQPRRHRAQGAQGGLRRGLRRGDQPRQRPRPDGGRHRLRARGHPRRGDHPHRRRGRPGQLRRLHAVAHRRHARDRGAHRALDRAPHRRRRARRAADRPGRGQRLPRRHRQTGAHPADDKVHAGLSPARLNEGFCRENPAELIAPNQ